jgi:hypothetical protein
MAPNLEVAMVKIAAVALCLMAAVGCASPEIQKRDANVEYFIGPIEQYRITESAGVRKYELRASWLLGIDVWSEKGPNQEMSELTYHDLFNIVNLTSGFIIRREANGERDFTNESVRWSSEIFFGTVRVIANPPEGFFFEEVPHFNLRVVSRRKWQEALKKKFY